MPNLTVLIPVHGASPYLEQAIRSIAVQDQLNIDELEILLILDRTTIELNSLISKFEGLPIKTIQSAKPGLVSALNLGLVNSTSEYIARLDSDDVMSPDRLYKQLSFLNKNPDCGVVASYTAVTDEHLAITRLSREPMLPDDIKKELEYRCCIAHPSVMYRKSLVIEAGSYREFYKHAEDYDLWLRMINITKIYTIPEFLTYYRTHSNQVSNVFYAQQQISTAAAQYSRKQKIKGELELHEIYTHLDSWHRSHVFRQVFIVIFDKLSQITGKKLFFKFGTKFNFSIKTNLKVLYRKIKNV